MAEVFFYHLSGLPVERALPKLLISAQKNGWRVHLRGSNEERLAWLDQKLWLDPVDEFLPHGIAGQDYDESQPILLSVAPENLNHAECLIAIDQAPLTLEQAALYQRACIVFDGDDSAALAHARGMWKTFSDDENWAPVYYKQENGRWCKKA